MTIKTHIFNTFRLVFKLPVLENWLRKKTNGLSKTNRLCRLAPNNYQYSIGTHRLFDYSGINIKADIRDYIGYCLYFGFKDFSNEKLIQLAETNFIVLDIGTNIGSTLLQFANQIGENGFVYGFEPDPINFKACQENIKLNRFNNLKVSNIGLGNENGGFNLVVDTETNRGGNRISLENKSQKENTIIQVERLDDWIKRNNIIKVELIKIDVEGFETNVLKGGIETIKKFMPVLFIELDDNNLRKVNSNAQELVKLLETINYNIINAENNKKVTSFDTFTNCHFDIICKP